MENRFTEVNIPSPTQIHHGLYLTTGRTQDGRLLAIYSDGLYRWVTNQLLF